MAIQRSCAPCELESTAHLALERPQRHSPHPDHDSEPRPHPQPLGPHLTFNPPLSILSETHSVTAGQLA